MTGLLIRNVEVDGRPGQDVRIAGGRITQIGANLSGPEADLDGRGGALLPGLHDHHIHLFGLAADAASVALDGAASPGAIAAALRAEAAVLPPGDWIRGVGYHEGGGSPLDRQALDGMIQDRPVRLQHRTGGLWVLNTAALALVMTADAPTCVERDDRGAPTGRIWRGDDWLRQRLAQSPPSLAAVSARLARCGVTGLTDASVTNDDAQAAVFARAIASGELRQHLMLMSGGPLSPPSDSAFAVGPVKVLLDDHNLPDLAEVAATIRQAHTWGRAVAVHCVTAAELALALAAFTDAGAASGDRIEHGGVVHPWAAAQIAALGLTVVTQPCFISERGDRYLAEVDAGDLAALYPCASLITAGVRLAAGSDAPYASPDPWAAMAAAASRTTRAGRPLGLGERITAHAALNLFMGPLTDPAGPARQLTPGAPADLCLLHEPLSAALERPAASLVAATLIAGEVAFRATNPPPPRGG